MAEQNTHTGMARPAVRIFADSRCEQISYFIKAKLQDVNVDALLQAIKAPESARAAGGGACPPGNEGSDFHLHVSWRTRKENFTIDVDFAAGAMAKPHDDEEPFAEDFFAWVEKFFVVKMVELRIDAEFSYPATERRSKFPLPLKASVGQETEWNIDGISFTLGEKPDGVAKIWLTQTSESLWVHAMSDRYSDLRTIDPKADIAALGRVMDKITEGKKQ